MYEIKKMEPDDWEAVKTIYEDGIATGNATFETHAPSWEAWDATHVKTCRLVTMENNGVTGWAALTAVSSRCIYAGVAEVSIYIAEKHRDKKIGTALLRALIQESESNGYWTLQAGVFPENKQSIAMHEKNGFRIIGYREKIGKMGNVWRDNIILERRSKVIGVD